MAKFACVLILSVLFIQLSQGGPPGGPPGGPMGPPPPGGRPMGPPPPGGPMGPPPPGSWPPPPPTGARPPPPPPPSSASKPPPASNGCLNTDLARNKKTAVDFYTKVFGQKQFHLVDQYVDANIISHNPQEVDGIDSLKQVLQGPLVDGCTVDIKKVAADGDLVWTHTRFTAPKLNAVFAIVDIFRINCAGKIAEHWDVIANTTGVQTNNPHPFF